MNLPWPTSTYIIFNSLGSSGCWQPMNTASYIHFNWNTIDFLFTHLIKNNNNNNKRKHELVWSKKQLNSDLKSYMTNRHNHSAVFAQALKLDVRDESYCSLGSDVSAAHNLGTCQRFLTLCSLPEWDQCRHIWKQDYIMKIVSGKHCNADDAVEKKIHPFLLASVTE